MNKETPEIILVANSSKSSGTSAPATPADLLMEDKGADALAVPEVLQEEKKGFSRFAATIQENSEVEKAIESLPDFYLFKNYPKQQPLRAKVLEDMKRQVTENKESPSMDKALIYYDPTQIERSEIGQTLQTKGERDQATPYASLAWYRQRTERLLTKHRMVVLTDIEQYGDSFGNEWKPSVKVNLLFGCGINFSGTSPAESEEYLVLDQKKEYYFKPGKLDQYREVMQLQYLRFFVLAHQHQMTAVNSPLFGGGLYLSLLAKTEKEAARKATHQAFFAALKQFNQLYPTHGLRTVCYALPPALICVTRKEKNGENKAASVDDSVYLEAKDIQQQIVDQEPLSFGKMHVIVCKKDMCQVTKVLSEQGHRVGQIIAGSDRTLLGNILNTHAQTQEELIGSLTEAWRMGHWTVNPELQDSKKYQPFDENLKAKTPRTTMRKVELATSDLSAELQVLSALLCEARIYRGPLKSDGNCIVEVAFPYQEDDKSNEKGPTKADAQQQVDNFSAALKQEYQKTGESISFEILQEFSAQKRGAYYILRLSSGTYELLQRDLTGLPKLLDLYLPFPPFQSKAADSDVLLQQPQKPFIVPEINPLDEKSKVEINNPDGQIISQPKSDGNSFAAQSSSHDQSTTLLFLVLPWLSASAMEVFAFRFNLVVSGTALDAMGAIGGLMLWMGRFYYRFHQHPNFSENIAPLVLLTTVVAGGIVFNLIWGAICDNVLRQFPASPIDTILSLCIGPLVATTLWMLIQRITKKEHFSASQHLHPYLSPILLLMFTIAGAIITDVLFNRYYLQGGKGQLGDIAAVLVGAMVGIGLWAIYHRASYGPNSFQVGSIFSVNLSPVWLIALSGAGALLFQIFMRELFSEKIGAGPLGEIVALGLGTLVGAGLWAISHRLSHGPNSFNTHAIFFPPPREIAKSREIAPPGNTHLPT